MRTKRVGGLTGVVVFAVVAALATGCGSSGSKATPASGGSTPTTVPSVAAGGGISARTTVPSDARKGASSKPTSEELAALGQQLKDVGSSISAADSAVTGSDVNTAKAQEGSAP